MKVLFSLNYSGIVDLDDYDVKALSLEEAKAQIKEIGYSELRRISKPCIILREIEVDLDVTFNAIPRPGLK